MGASSLIVLMISAVAFSGIAMLISKVVLKATKNKQRGSLMSAVFQPKVQAGYNSMLDTIFLH
jgi:hypothetical protein